MFKRFERYIYTIIIFSIVVGSIYLLIKFPFWYIGISLVGGLLMCMSVGTCEHEELH